MPVGNGLSLPRFGHPGSRSLPARRSEPEKLGDEERDQPNCGHVAPVGSEEHREKGRSGGKAHSPGLSTQIGFEAARL
jgi:hypothetical protein